MRSTRRRDCEPPLPEPLAYFLTWPTYGTWLPGDERGWVEYRHGWQLPDPARKREAQARLTEDACLLDQDQRRLVELTIADHCRVRGWTLSTVNCRSNQVHVIVAGDREPKEIREQFKAWCTRRLKALQQFPACGFRPENTLVLISHFANSLRIMLSRTPYLTAWANGVARHGTCFR